MLHGFAAQLYIFNFFFKLCDSVIQSIKTKGHIVELAFSKTGIFRQTVNFIFKTSFIEFHFSKLIFIVFEFSV